MKCTEIKTNALPLIEGCNTYQPPKRDYSFDFGKNQCLMNGKYFGDITMIYKKKERIVGIDVRVNNGNKYMKGQNITFQIDSA